MTPVNKVDAKFYIYYHIDPISNLPRYVGKGSGNRAWSFYNRNRFHKHWVAKLKRNGLEPIVEIGNYFGSEEEAYQIEKTEIELLKKLNCALTNLAEGGWGGTESLTRKPIRCLNDGTIYGSTKIAADILGIQPKRICDVLKGRKPSYRGLSFRYVDDLSNTDPDKLRLKKEKWNKTTTSKSVVCNETNEIFHSITAAAEKIGASNSTICAHLGGRLKHVKNFTFRRNK